MTGSLISHVHLYLWLICVSVRFGSHVRSKLLIAVCKRGTAVVGALRDGLACGWTSLLVMKDHIVEAANGPSPSDVAGSDGTTYLQLFMD